MNQNSQFTSNSLITKRAFLQIFFLLHPQISLKMGIRNCNKNNFNKKGKIPGKVHDLFAEHYKSLRCIKEVLNKLIDIMFLHHKGDANLSQNNRFMKSLLKI